ncbi:MAG: hypothetical protein AVDCRST_MAG49-654, partial [uncultured Thermomicrobiales bacterium]
GGRPRGAGGDRAVRLRPVPGRGGRLPALRRPLPSGRRAGRGPGRGAAAGSAGRARWQHRGARLPRQGRRRPPAALRGGRPRRDPVVARRAGIPTARGPGPVPAAAPGLRRDPGPRRRALPPPPPRSSQGRPRGGGAATVSRCASGRPDARRRLRRAQARRPRVRRRRRHGLQPGQGGVRPRRDRPTDTGGARRV